MVEPQQGEHPEPLEATTVIEPIQPSPTSEPTTVGRFQIVHLLAQGGHATIYEVSTPDAGGQRHALKLLNTEMEPVVRWFEKGASVTARLNHPHILPCHESGRIDGRPYMLMPHVDGDSVTKAVLHGNVMPGPAEVVRIARAVAAALDYAHGRDVVHGNVHPNHVLLSRTGHVWLIGFAEVGVGYPEEMIFGNPHHLAPEQFCGFETAVPQTDVYALAEVVFLLLSGSFPFQGVESTIDLFERKRSGPAPSIRGRRPELPRTVDLTLQRAMSVRPEDRFRSAGQFVEELDGALGLCQEADKKWWQFWR
jgi:serine/threonine-protein kinase